MIDPTESYRDQGGLPADETADDFEREMPTDAETDLLSTAVIMMLENAGFVVESLPDERDNAAA